MIEQTETLEAKRDRLGEQVAVMRTELDSFREAIKAKQSELRVNESYEARDRAFDELKKLLADHDALNGKFQEAIKEWSELPRG